MDIAIDRLTEFIGRVVHQAEFTNVFKERYNSCVMNEFYARKWKRAYSLSSTDSINVREDDLTALVSELEPILAPYTSSKTGKVGNGLYKLTGSLASPRLPSVEEYAKLLVLAAARVGPERVVNLFDGWVKGHPIRIWMCALLKGARTEDELKPVDGLCLETLPSNGEEFPRSLYVRSTSTTSGTSNTPIERYYLSNTKRVQHCTLRMMKFLAFQKICLVPQFATRNYPRCHWTVCAERCRWRSIIT